MAGVNLNRVCLTGNLTRDPELRTTSGGTSVCSLRVACNTRRKDGSTGVDRQVTADFVGPALNFATAEIHPVERSVARADVGGGLSVAG